MPTAAEDAGSKVKMKIPMYVPSLHSLPFKKNLIKSLNFRLMLVPIYMGNVSTFRDLDKIFVDPFTPYTLRGP